MNGPPDQAPDQSPSGSALRPGAVLVTGATGYLGAEVADALTRDGRPVVRLGGPRAAAGRAGSGSALVGSLDLAASGARAALASLLQAHGVTAVVHLAADKRADQRVSDPGALGRRNVAMTRTVLDAMRATGTARLVFASSLNVYRSPTGPAQLLREDARVHAHSPYAESKLVGEREALTARDAWGLRTVVLRQANVAGSSGDRVGSTSDGLIWSLLDDALAGRRPVISSAGHSTPDGTAVRDYVHVDDLARAYVAAIALLDRDECHHVVVNAGTGHGSSVLDVVRAVEQVTGRQLDPLVGEVRAAEPPVLVPDVTRAATRLGWSARRSLPEVVGSAWAALVRAPDTRRAVAHE